MNSAARMSPAELRASLSLAAIFALRLFGMFIILPVFTLWAEGRPGWSLTLKGARQYGNPMNVRFQGVGIVGGEQWIYDYEAIWCRSGPTASTSGRQSWAR